MSCSGRSDLLQCGQSFPPDHCCPSVTACRPIYLSDNTTLPNATICCPNGSECNIIQTVTCDISQFNATLHPENQIHVDAGVALPTCDTACCPPGYTCKNNMCFRDVTKAATGPSSSSLRSVATTSATSTPSSSPLPLASRPGSNNVLVIALGSALGGVFFFSLMLGIFLVRRYGFLWGGGRAGTSGNKEKKISWNKAELEDTQKKAVWAELGTEHNAHELRASRDASELPA
jgi:hypothetical protein